MNKQEFLQFLRDNLTDSTSDQALEAFSDIDSKFDTDGGQAETLRAQLAEAQQKIVDTDTEWRIKYRDAFLNPPDVKPDETLPIVDPQIIETEKIEDLFESKEIEYL